MPLDKAFYLLHIEVNQLSKSNSELSFELSLPEKTIWQFRRKIKETEKALTTRTFKPSFDDIILEGKNIKNK